MRAVWWVVVALWCSMAGGMAHADDPGMTVVEPSPDLPPVETTSPKVQAGTNPDLPPALGPAPAKVYLVVFCAYRNADCRRMARAARQIPNEWPGEVRLEIRHVPGVHAWGKAAALAALAAHRQGKFWPMHECLFAHQDTLDAGTPAVCAQEVGLDLERFDRDMASPKLAARVDREASLARGIGILQVPAYTINGRLFVGWGTWELLQGSVAEERRQVDALMASGKTLHRAQLMRTGQNAPKNPAALAAYTELMKHLHRGITDVRKP